MDATNHVKSIAETIEQIHNGIMWLCPHCGESFLIAPDCDDEPLCPDCGDCDEPAGPMTFDDYFQDSIYNIEYRAGSKHDDINSVSVMIACGGPNIYIDTGDKKVKLYWGFDYRECDISTGAADEITDYFNEIWNCE